ncbi:MAG: type IV pilus assembly protein PilM [Candidatus Niyogibacteria bacterium]|nr:type IV pilus assembly protein PilM [Candidatus Niyogibacteria bacterium]
MRAFYRLFPPPKYLSVPSVGLDLSDRSFKYIALSKAHHGVRIEKYGKVSTPPGIIESGIIKKRKELVDLLASNSLHLNIEYAAISLPEEKAFLYVTELPLMDKDKIRDAVEVQLEEHVPLPPHEVVFDFEVLPVNDAKNGPIDVSVAAYPKSIIDEYRDVLEEAGITPVSFEIEAQSIVRAVIPQGSGGAVLIIDFGKTRTSFFIVSSGQLRFTTTINVGGEAIDRAISKNFKVDISKAEGIKKEQGNIFNMAPDSDVYTAIMPIASVIKDEAEKSLDFWETHAEHLHDNSRIKIEKIILCGGDANLYGLPEYLSRSLKVKTELANVWVNVVSLEDYIPEISFRESLGYATAIGLGLKILET